MGKLFASFTAAADKWECFVEYSADRAMSWHVVNQLPDWSFDVAAGQIDLAWQLSLVVLTWMVVQPLWACLMGCLVAVLETAVVVVALLAHLHKTENLVVLFVYSYRAYVVVLLAVAGFDFDVVAT